MFSIIIEIAMNSNSIILLNLFGLLFLPSLCVTISTDGFYPFGEDEGDNVLTASDESSSAEIYLNQSFLLFNQDFSSLFVS